MLFLSTDMLILAKRKTTCQQQPRQKNWCFRDGAGGVSPPAAAELHGVSVPGFSDLVATQSGLRYIT